MLPMSSKFSRQSSILIDILRISGMITSQQHLHHVVNVRLALRHSQRSQLFRPVILSRWSSQLSGRPGSSPVSRQRTVQQQPVGASLPKQRSLDIHQAEAVQFQQLLEKRRKRYYFIASLFLAWVSAYLFYTWRSYTNDLAAYNARPDKLPQNADVSDRWKNNQRNFDYEVDSSEKAMLMKRKRKRLIARAYGDVLEVSVGTGRNMDLYDTRPYDELESSKMGRSTERMITSLTFNDQSEVMIDAARKKWEKSQAKRPSVDKFHGKVDFVVGDAGIPGVIPRPIAGYDTIVQSMGICSMADPVGFLQHLSQLARQPGEKTSEKKSGTVDDKDDGQGGRIFLLEHGRASTRWFFINRYLDNSAAMHADRYGCWFNKDIEKVIDDSGLIVESIKRSSFGTVWEIVLRPSPNSKSVPDSAAMIEPKGKSRSWWSRK